MLCTYLVFAALAGYHVQGASIKHETPKSITTRIINIVQAKCSQNTNPENLDKVLNQLGYVGHTCWKNMIPNLNQSPEKSKQICRENLPHFIECLRDFTEKVEPCLKPEEHFLKHFIVAGYQKYFDYFCENIQAISFVEDTKTKEPQLCINKFKDDPEINPYFACSAELKGFGDGSQLITKSKLCQDLSNVRSCYEKIISEECPDAQEMKSFYLGKMGAALEQCSEK